MCEQVNGSGGTTQDLQTGSYLCESVTPPLLADPAAKGWGGGPGCDGYLWGRVTTNGKGVEGEANAGVLETRLFLFTVGSIVNLRVLVFLLVQPFFSEPHTFTAQRFPSNLTLK